MKKTELEQKLKNAGIGAYKKTAEKLLETPPKKGDIIYKAQAPYYGYNGYVGGSVRAYIWEDTGIGTLFENLSAHRAKVAIQHYNEYRKGNISPEVWGNYITGGYNTRQGLFSKNIDKKRLENIAKSHEKCKIKGEEGHNIRVILRE